MDSNSYQSLAEAYQSIYSSQENLEEQSVYGGFSVGRGKKSVTGSVTDKRGNTFGLEAGQVQSKDADAAAKATTTNALAKLQDAERGSDTAPKQVTSLASKTSSVKPGATGASALGGPLSLSAADKAPRAATAPKIDRVPEVQTKKANYLLPNVQLAPQQDAKAPTKVDPKSAKPKPKPNPTEKPKPTDRPEGKLSPQDMLKPIAPKTPTPRVETPKPAPVVRREPTVNAGGTAAAPVVRQQPAVAASPVVRREPPAVGRDAMVARNIARAKPQSQMASYEMDAYNLVLEYLLDEGFASTEQSADKIILNMSESWFEEIMEGRRNPEVEEKGKKVGEYERAGKYKGITDKFREEHPGSREEKKERGSKKSEGDQQADQRAFRSKLQSKYGRTKKQQREAEIMSKHTSARD